MSSSQPAAGAASRPLPLASPTGASSSSKAGAAAGAAAAATDRLPAASPGKTAAAAAAAMASAAGAELDLTGIDQDLARFQQDELVRQALGRGVELKGYAAQIEQELKEVEMESVKEYVQQSSNVLALHSQIQSCDMILARMQEMLLGFQADLGGISEEIRHLQEESRSMSVKLQNRRDVEAQLQKFLDKMVLPPDMVATLTGKEVNDAYVEYTLNLNSRIAFVSQAAPAADGSSLDLAPRETQAGQDLAPKLERLRLRAVAKARDYFLGKIAELRRPKTHVQMVQRHGLLKYQHLMAFLQQNAPEVAEEVRGAYVETMGRTVFALFRAYHAQLQKLLLEVANKNDLIAVEEGAVRGLFTTKVDLSKRGDAFALADRDKILEQVEAEPILVHIAQAEGAKYPYEVLMRSVFKHLVEAATCEYLFTHDFFKPGPQGKATETFNAVFARTLSLCLENLENHLFGCYDAIGLLLMIRLTVAFRLVMQRRRVPVLDAFFDRVTMLLWPRFKALFDANLKSVRAANAKKLGTVDLHPHYVSRRYAEFAATCLALHAAAPSPFPAAAGGLDHLPGLGLGLGLRPSPSVASVHSAASVSGAAAAGGEDMLLNDVKTLTREVLTLLQRLAERQRGPRERFVFLINNYDQVLNVFHERRVDGGEERAKFEDALAQQRELFVEEELRAGCFGRLVAFVKETEAGVLAGPAEADGSYPVDARQAEALAREFAGAWKGGIEAINQDVLAFFANFRNGMEVLKQVLTQLLLYYTRFQEIVKKGWPRNPPAWARDLVPTAAILVEIRKYSRAF